MRPSTTQTTFQSCSKTEAADHLEIAVFTFAGDLHAERIAHELNSYHDVHCLIVEVDELFEDRTTCWSSDESRGTTSLRGADNSTVVVEQLDAIWWRRTKHMQRGLSGLQGGACRDVVNNDCEAAIFGITSTRFNGRWINEPTATRRGENKLIQLDVAQAVGLRVPRTCVTQDPEEVRRLFEDVRGEAIVKPLVGTRRTPLPTVKLQRRHLDLHAAIRSAPAIYQEYVPGTEHIRIQCFGDTVLAAVIESSDVDWRGDMSRPIRSFDLPANIEQALREVLERLGLRMGLVDMKRRPDGEFVWLEVNPQGQFLFVEALASMDLTRSFASFLKSEAVAARSDRNRAALHIDVA
jgi:glutathione synthase/RimK-type ligase-like ATP-grasp enzyme